MRFVRYIPYPYYQTLANEKEMLRWSIIPEHIPWENRGVDPEKRNMPIEKA
jgi:hypothetical protein